MPTEFENSAHWIKVYEQIFFAEPVMGKPGEFKPIPDQILPIQFSSHILAVAASSSIVKPNWWLAARFYQLIAVPGSQFPKLLNERSHRAGVNRNTLLQFEKISNSYQLRLNIPFWQQEMSIAIWQYIGPEQ